MRPWLGIGERAPGRRAPGGKPETRRESPESTHNRGAVPDVRGGPLLVPRPVRLVRDDRLDEPRLRGHAGAAGRPLRPHGRPPLRGHRPQRGVPLPGGVPRGPRVGRPVRPLPLPPASRSRRSPREPRLRSGSSWSWPGERSSGSAGPCTCGSCWPRTRPSSGKACASCSRATSVWSGPSPTLRRCAQARRLRPDVVVARLRGGGPPAPARGREGGPCVFMNDCH